jgi:hypothetical protein
LPLLASEDTPLADALLGGGAALGGGPKTVLPELDAALLAAQQRLLAGLPANSRPASVKHNAHARPSGLCRHLDSASSSRASEICAQHLDRLVTVRGTVVRAGPVQALEAKRLYECTRCRHRFAVAADPEAGGAAVQLPASCPDAGCKGSAFKECEDAVIYTNYREVQLRDGGAGASGATGLGGGSGGPRALAVILQDELVDGCHVGGEVEVTGVVVRQFPPKLFPGMRCHVGLALAACCVAAPAEPADAAGMGVAPEAAAAFEAFWRAHRYRPMAGRDKVGLFDSLGVRVLPSAWIFYVIQF